MGLYNNTVVFVHLAKTGGTTLLNILNRNYSQTERLDIRPPNQQQQIEKFKNLPIEVRAKYKLLTGHGVFQLHDYIINPYYMTLLRNPIDRVISEYYFLKRPVFRNYSVHQKIVSKNMGLEEYITSGILKDVDNGQVRTLSKMDCAYGDCSPEMLQKAKDNVEKYFPVIGITEDFDRFLILAKKMLKLRSFLFYKRQNITSKKPKILNFSSATIKTIEKYNQLDIELYEFVKKKFDETYRLHCTEADIVVFKSLNHGANQLKILQAKITR